VKVVGLNSGVTPVVSGTRNQGTTTKKFKFHKNDAFAPFWPVKGQQTPFL
jgi:hypothetical protein